MNDTPPEIAELVRGRLLARSGAERLQMGSRMFDAARELVLASFPPGLPEIEVKRRLCERFYGDEVDVEAFVEYLRSRESNGPSKSSGVRPPFQPLS
jgi:hypothetical protein